MVRQRLLRPRGPHELGGGDAYRVASRVLNSLARPFVILPTQVDRHPADDSGEVKLLRYILLSAIADIAAAVETGPAGGERRANAAQAWRWMAGYPGAPIDFETACAAFGMSAAAIRRHVARVTGFPHRPPSRPNG